MEGKRQTESVLAKLMGLDRPLSSNSIRHGRRRAFSESYLQDMALISQHQKWSFDRFSMDIESRRDSSEDLQSFSSSEENLDRYRIEDKLFEKIWFPTKKTVQSNGEKRTSFRKRERDCSREDQRHRIMETHGVAKQVTRKLQHSVWHDYLKSAGFVEANGGIGSQIPGKMNTSVRSTGRSMCRNKKYNVHKDWCFNLQKEKCETKEDVAIDLSEFVERDLFEETPSVCISPKEIASICKEDVIVDAISQEVPLQQEDNEVPLCQMEDYKPNPDAASNNNCSVAQSSPIQVFYPEAKRQKKMDFKIEETPALSYLIDVLSESGFRCENLETCYKLGKPLENPINPFVFDALEKKYSKQSSWLKSERRLLLDRIKSAFSDILHPNTGMNTWGSYKKNRLLFYCSQDIIKEEMLSIMVKQEKEAKRMSSDKVVGIDGDWLELEEDMQIVVKEIEDILINELINEIVSTELLI